MADDYFDQRVAERYDASVRDQFDPAVVDPAVDVLGSLSRLMPQVVDAEHAALAQEMREVLAHWREGRDLVEIGAYRAGSNPALDRALVLVPAIEAFLRQGTDEPTTLDETVALLRALFSGAAGRET